MTDYNKLYTDFVLVVFHSILQSYILSSWNFICFWKFTQYCRNKFLQGYTMISGSNQSCLFLPNHDTHANILVPSTRLYRSSVRIFICPYIAFMIWSETSHSQKMRGVVSVPLLHIASADNVTVMQPVICSGAL